MKLIQPIGAALTTSALLVVALPGCDKQEGDMEQAGKKVDLGLESAGKQTEKAGDNVQDATKVEKE